MEVLANNSLYISNISEVHYGTYQCYAANQIGAARLEIDVLQPGQTCICSTEVVVVVMVMAVMVVVLTIYKYISATIARQVCEFV